MDHIDELDKELSDAIGQRNVMWHADRLGRFTSSKYKDLLQSGKKKDDRYGSACMKYVYEKIGEMLSQSQHNINSKAMDWGKKKKSLDMFESQKDRPKFIRMIENWLKPCQPFHRYQKAE